jgi:DNA-binding beta-propeller fold protein YncE
MLTKFCILFALSCNVWAATIENLGGGGFMNAYGLVIGPDGALYVCEIGTHRITRLDLKTGKRSVVAGHESRKGFAGEGGAAAAATLNEPYEIRFDRDGNLFFVDMPNAVVLRVDRKTGVLTRVAGTGVAGFSGDGGPAVNAQLRQPHSIAFAPDGSLLICDIGNHRIRRVDLKSGKIETWAGTGERAPTPDGAPLKGTPLNGPRAIDFDGRGNLYLALREGNAVYRIDLKSERIFHVAGTGEKGNSGDGGDAKVAKLSGPKGVSCGRDGSVYIADTENHTIRVIKGGVIRTIAGTGSRGDGPVGDPLKCGLARPHGVFVDRGGRVYIGDSENNQVRVVR